MNTAKSQHCVDTVPAKLAVTNVGVVSPMFETVFNEFCRVHDGNIQSAECTSFEIPIPVQANMEDVLTVASSFRRGGVGCDPFTNAGCLKVCWDKEGMANPNPTSPYWADMFLEYASPLRASLLYSTKLGQRIKDSLGLITKQDKVILVREPASYEVFPRTYRRGWSLRRIERYVIVPLVTAELADSYGYAVYLVNHLGYQVDFIRVLGWNNSQVALLIHGGGVA